MDDEHQPTTSKVETMIPQKSNEESNSSSSFISNAARNRQECTMMKNIQQQQLQEQQQEDVDAILAKELYKMSVIDRNKVQEEVHGVYCIAPEETPQLVLHTIQTFTQEFKRLTTTTTTTMDFQQALQQQKTHAFVHIQEFVFRFLRSELFDGIKAAKRMILNLQLLYKYFGIEGIQRPLRLADLTKQEFDLLRNGNNQILPSRDRAGRLIYFFHGSMDTTVPSSSRLRVVLYQMQVLSEDVETQIKGFVSICAPDENVISNQSRISDPKEKEDWRTCFQSHPVRMSAMHLLHPPGPQFQLIKALWILVMTVKGERVRTKFYTGLTTETTYKLMSFGIPVQEIPISSTGTIKTKNHLLWIKGRKIIDDARKKERSAIFDDTTNRIFHPRVNDVLFSRGGNTTHFGNVEYNQILTSKIEQYNAESERRVRGEIRDSIIDEVFHDQKGRFLQSAPDDGWWMEITDIRLLRDKVSNSLYDYNRKESARKNRQESKSETSTFLYSRKKRQRVEGTGADDSDVGNGCFFR